jgi:hypothetical protein
MRIAFSLFFSTTSNTSASQCDSKEQRTRSMFLFLAPLRGIYTSFVPPRQLHFPHLTYSTFENQGSMIYGEVCCSKNNVASNNVRIVLWLSPLLGVYNTSFAPLLLFHSSHFAFPTFENFYAPPDGEVCRPENNMGNTYVRVASPFTFTKIHTIIARCCGSKIVLAWMHVSGSCLSKTRTSLFMFDVVISKSITVPWMCCGKKDWFAQKRIEGL